MKFGFLRESTEKALQVGVDKETGIWRTGLDEYLSVIFPNTNDWIHDKMIPNSGRRFKPDYRSESLKMIVEFDGTAHYMNPDKIISDEEATKFYESLGYKVVRIPFFIQLTNSVVKQLFNVDVQEQLFPEGVHSFTVKERATPAYMCLLGAQRCFKELKMFSEQYKTNIEYLKTVDSRLSGLDLLDTSHHT